MTRLREQQTMVSRGSIVPQGSTCPKSGGKGSLQVILKWWSHSMASTKKHSNLKIMTQIVKYWHFLHISKIQVKVQYWFLQDNLSSMQSKRPEPHSADDGSVIGLQMMTWLDLNMCCICLKKIGIKNKHTNIKHPLCSMFLNIINMVSCKSGLPLWILQEDITLYKMKSVYCECIHTEILCW